MADTFDSTRVPYAFTFVQAQAIASPDFTPTVGDTTWFHFRMFPNGGGVIADQVLMRVFDINQNKICELIRPQGTDTSIELNAFDSAGSTSVNGSFPMNNTRMNSVDVKITVLPGAINTRLYINGGLAAIADHPTNTLSWTNPVHFTFHGAYANTGDNTQYISEVLVSDTDTRNARMSLLRPTTVGGETDWVGDVTQLSDDDPTSGMTTLLANQRQTVNLSAYTGASNISSMVVATQSVAGVGAPQNMRHLVRMSAVNYEGPADLPLSETIQYDITDFQTNPATSLPWVAADLATLEIGFISKV